MATSKQATKQVTKQAKQQKSVQAAATAAATRKARHRPTGSSPADPLVPFQVWKIKRSTLEKLQAAAEERGCFASALVRKILDEWVTRSAAARKAA